MRKFILYLLPILSIILCCCNNLFEDEHKLIDKNAKYELFEIKSTLIQDYIDSFGRLMSEIHEINSKKDSKRLQEIVDMYDYAKFFPDEYSSKLEDLANEIYTGEELTLIKSLYEELNALGNKLKENQDFISMQSNERRLFVDALSWEIPKVKSAIDEINEISLINSRAEVSPNECRANCQDSYYYELMTIAAGSICAIGGTVVAACASLGTLSINAIIALIIEVTGTSILIDNATAQYNICLRSCGQ